jgi:hypothetical protein
MKWRAIVLCFVAIFIVGCVSAKAAQGQASEAKGAPVIVDWSSHGGRVKNKDDARDRMYLVQSGDRITFEVKARNAREYEWQVNKVVQEGVRGSSFSWVVPEEKGIWEIHVVVKGDEGEAHCEWVVSTLTDEEAPTIFDYFADGRYFAREETDPWGRRLPEWGEADRGGAIKAKPEELYDASKGFMEKRRGMRGYVFLSSKVAFGTWRIRYRGSLDYCFVGRKNRGRVGYGPGQYIYSHAATGTYAGHMWFRGVLPRDLFPPERIPVKYLSYGYPSRYSLAWSRGIAMYGSDLGLVPGWVDLVIIRTPDGSFYPFVNRRMMLGLFNIDSTFKVSDFIRTGSKTFDCVEVYNRRYLFPEKGASYAEYTSRNMKQTQGELIVEKKKKGIVITGRGVRLRNIARLLGKPKLFRYDEQTRTAVCYTNLVVSGGAELVLKGETLRMHCKRDGEHEIRIMQGATIKVIDSRITSDTEHYYLWRFTSPYESENYEPPLPPTRGGFFDARCVVILRDSTIENCGYIYLQSPRGLVLENVKFLNVFDADGGRMARAYEWRDDVGTAAKVGFWYLDRMPTVPLRKFEGLVVRGKRGAEPVSFVFDGGDPFGELTIRDSVFKHCVIRVRSFNRICGGGIKWDWQEPDGTKLWAVGPSSRTLNLVNCKFERLEADNLWAWINVKYYLDVKVVDEKGKPIPGARVAVRNEVDDEHHPAEALPVGWHWTSTYAEGYGNHLVPFQKWSPAPVLRSVLTGEDGHTPLPSEPSKTLVITDYTFAHPDNFDGLQLSWSTLNDSWAISVDICDDEKGQVLRRYNPGLSYDSLLPGSVHHVTVEYDQRKALFRVTIKDDAGRVVYDTGKFPLVSQDRKRILRPRFEVDEIAFRVLRAGRGEMIEWRKDTDGDGYIYMYGAPYSQGGFLKVRIDNMNLEVEGVGKVEHNTYPRAPDFKVVTLRSHLYYGLPRGTRGRSFRWTFDLKVLEHNRRFKGYVAVCLRGRRKEPVREYTYTIEVSAPGFKKKVVKGIDPNPGWYREEPNKPTHTVEVKLRVSPTSTRSN